VFETYADRALGGAVAGGIDGALALIVAQELQMPKNAVIYFAVDFDAGDDAMDAIEAYLKAAKSELGDYEIGVYGSFAVIEEMAARGACKGFWQTYAWSQGQKSAHTNVYQYSNDETLAGISVDFDEAESLSGMWDYKKEAAAPGQEENMVRYAYLKDIPSENGFRDIVDKLMSAGVVMGDGSDSEGNCDLIDLSHDQVRSLVFEYRGGAFDRKLCAAGISPAVEL